MEHRNPLYIYDLLDDICECKRLPDEIEKGKISREVRNLEQMTSMIQVETERKLELQVIIHEGYFSQSPSSTVSLLGFSCGVARCETVLLVVLSCVDEREIQSPEYTATGLEGDSVG